MDEVDYLIVGCGFAGIVLAERLANELDKTVLIVEKRDHIGGNAYDAYDRAGILIHKYGPHYFRTNADRIREYLERFTEWHMVDYKVLSYTGGKYWQFPINLNTFEQFIGHPSTSEEMEATLKEWRVPIRNPQNAEEAIISKVGWKLYEMFFRNYTRKQWQRDPKDLLPSIVANIPIRTNRDDRYLSDKFQGMPKDGYTAMFARMLNHRKIKVVLNTHYREILPQIKFKHLIFTGAVDEYFDYCFGALPYRSLRFEPETLEVEYYQRAMQINYPNDHEFTRISEIKHVTGQRAPVTTIVREYPASTGEPFYPIPAPDAQALYKRYEERADALTDVTFVGRLATYRYYDMDQVIGMALAKFEQLRKRDI